MSKHMKQIIDELNDNNNNSDWIYVALFLTALLLLLCWVTYG